MFPCAPSRADSKVGVALVFPGYRTAMGSRSPYSTTTEYRSKAGSLSGSVDGIERHVGALGGRQGRAPHSPQHREAVAAITQVALDIKRHRDLQKERRRSKEKASDLSASPDKQRSFLDISGSGSIEYRSTGLLQGSRGGNDMTGDAGNRAYSHVTEQPLNLEHMMSAIEVDAAHLAYKAQTLSARLPQSDGGGDAEGVRDRDKKSVLKRCDSQQTTPRSHVTFDSSVGLGGQ